MSVTSSKAFVFSSTGLSFDTLLVLHSMLIKPLAVSYPNRPPGGDVGSSELSSSDDIFSLMISSTSPFLRTDYLAESLAFSLLIVYMVVPPVASNECALDPPLRGPEPIDG